MMMIMATTMMTTTTMTRATTDHMGSLRVVAVVAAIILGGSACSSGADSSEGAGSANSTGSESEGSQPTDAALADSELSARLDTIIVALRDAYTFDTRVELGGELVTEVEGNNIAGASEFTISTSGTTLDVISIGSQVWSRLEGAPEWSSEAASDLSADPLGPLLDSTIRTVAGEQITVVYPGASFGLDVAEVDVLVRLDGTAIELVHQAGDVTVRSRLEAAHPDITVTAPA